ncbi:MAG: hypothetical protein P8R43_08060, partial [Planctomycetota bacterium]|nr:hypothetical protein [Planctomycetota bacterium]
MALRLPPMGRLAAALAAAFAIALAYAALALAGHAPGGWRLRTLIHSPAELADAERAAHRSQRLAAFAEEVVTPGGVLFIGSSTIEFFDLARAFPGVNTINRGIGDEPLAALSERFEESICRTDCAAVVLYGGSVDLRRLQRPPAAIARDIQRLLDDAARQAPRARVLILGILPEREMPLAMGARIEAANEALAALAGSRPLVSFVETSRPPLVQASSGALVPGMSTDRL